MLRPVSRRFMRPIGLFVLYGLTSPVGAAVYCVDSAAALQNALLTAANNNADDEIKIVRGTYVGNFVYGSTQANALAVKGGYAAGCGSRTLNAANTILDGNQTDTVLTLSAPNVAAELLMEGLTLRNGKSNGSGAGLYANVGRNGEVTVTLNQITGNTASYSGSGVYVNADSGTATLTDNHIEGNTASHSGSGVYVKADSGTATLTNNHIEGNTARKYGGGVYVDANSGTAITLTNNHIKGNTASYSGGGVYFEYGTATLTNNHIEGNNTARYSGGGVYTNLIPIFRFR